MANFQQTLEQIIHQSRAESCGESAWSGHCPAHGSQNSPDLSIKFASGKILLTCHAGCGFNDILAAFGMKPQDMFESHSGGSATIEKPSNEKPSSLSPEQLHEIFAFILIQLQLSDTHKTQLLKRGLTEFAITQNEYRTLPQRKRAALAKAIINRFGETDATQTPGVYFKPAESGGGYYSFAGAAGLLIPSRNIAGQITGFKIRVDNPEATERYGKYLALSSAKKPSGTVAGDHCHIRFMDDVQHVKTLWITEGELKADVAALLAGANFIALPGVGKWKKSLPIIEKFNQSVLLLRLIMMCGQTRV